MGCAWLRRRCRGNHGTPPHNPRPRWPSQGLNRCDPESSQAVPFGGTVLPLLAHGYLLEVRDSAELRGRFLHPIGAFAPPEIYHEEPAQCAFDWCRFDFLLASIFGHQFGCED